MTAARLGVRDHLLAVVAATAWVAIVRPGPLDLPYFWDEADVYVPGARFLAEHGFDPTPGVFPDDYSRGHPPLFYLVAAVAFALFGPGPVVGHLVVLPFTVLALAGTYLLGAGLFGRLTGGSAAALLAATPLFLSIGNMLLPEVPLVAGTVLAFHAFARGRLLAAVLVASALVLVKETGIFTAAALGGAVLYDAWRRRTLATAAARRRALLATVPLVVLLGFFGWQKATAGYFVFPHHQHLFAERAFEPANVVTVFPSLLAWHGRFLVVAAAALAVLAGGAGARTAIAGPGHGEPIRERWTPLRDSVLFAMYLLVLFNAVFFSRMFWLERYALPAHPGILIMAAGALAAGAHATARRLTRERGARAVSEATVALVTAIVAVLGVRGAFGPAPPHAEEQTFAYADVIATHRAAFARIDAARDPLVLTTWPMTVELTEPSLGYVATPIRTVHARRLATDSSIAVDAILIDGASDAADALEAAARARGFHRSGIYRVGRSPTLSLWQPFPLASDRR